MLVVRRCTSVDEGGSGSQRTILVMGGAHYFLITTKYNAPRTLTVNTGVTKHLWIR
jgi:hypothetical protein